MEHLLPLFVTWDVNPALLHIGSFEIRYYGLLWAIALGISAYIFHNIMQREGLSEKAFDSIFWFGVISTVVGARLGHCARIKCLISGRSTASVSPWRSAGWPSGWET